MTFDIEHPYVLTATCASRMGTTAAVTTFLATRRFYIVEMQQFDDTISQRFFVRVTFCGVQGEPVNLARLAQGIRDDRRRRGHGVADPRFARPGARADHGVELRPLPRGPAVSPPHRRAGDGHHGHRLEPRRRCSLRPPSTAFRFSTCRSRPQTKPQQEQRLLELIESTRTDLVVLARYMQILSDDLCGKLRGRAINIHHSFLPGFKGAKPYHQAYDRGREGDRRHGALRDGRPRRRPDHRADRRARGPLRTRRRCWWPPGAIRNDARCREPCGSRPSTACS